MLNAVGRTADGRPLIMVGMTGETITRLMAAEPVPLDIHEKRFGVPPLQILLVAARDEITILHQLRSSGMVPPCCPNHGTACVEPDERCCLECAESTHDDHPIGVTCVLDDPRPQAAKVTPGDTSAALPLRGGPSTLGRG